MKAIRCKSSSQVSSQVMIRFELVLLYLVLVTAQKQSDIAFQIFHGNIEKYELCVKLIRVCRNVWDKEPDYGDVKEPLPGENEVQDEDKAEYRKAHCVPKGLSAYGEQQFWEIAAKWQRYIDDRFLIQNLFMVIETTNKGRNIKMAFGKWQGWCNRTDVPNESTEPTETEEESTERNFNEREELKYCNENGTFGQFIFSEIDGTRKLDRNMNRISEILKQLEKLAIKNCCPYDSIRDRLEIINDGIDILQNLQGKESTEKPEYTDLNSDLSRLKTRLEDFNVKNVQGSGANYSTGKCCPNILIELNNYKNNFLDNLENINSQKPSLNFQPLLEKAKNLQDILLSQLKDIRQLESSLGNKNNKNTCCNDGKEKIKNIEKILTDVEVKDSLEELTKLIEPLKESLAKTNQTLSDAESLLNLENESIQKLNSLYGKECRHKDTLIKNLHLNMSNLEHKINNLSSINSVDWPKLKKSVEAADEMVKKSPSVLYNITIIRTTIKRTLGRTQTSEDLESKNSSSVRFCSNDSIRINTSLEKINKDRKDTIAYHELQDNIDKERIKELQDKQKDLEKYDPKPILKSVFIYRNTKPSSLQLEINQLERDLDNLTENGINKLDRQLQYTQLKFEIEKEKLDRKVEEQLKNINLFREEMKREQDLIDDRLAKLAATMKTPTEYDEKLRKVEAEALEYQKQIESYEKELLQRIDSLQQQLKDLDEAAENTEHRADICDAECDFGDLDSVDKLIGRVKAVKSKLAVEYKRTPSARKVKPRRQKPKKKAG
ncbi:putative leucine-rich repeat-containing protein DDB_G0290503 [Drosophila takahashii]|uniref:putative leucine-rich repeat-containing protein DDB_G0290503 n=1 Tax=Drosophila takahashii TaxID=29030 RepID=UPI001CF892AE|nr:myosin-10 [Drosophila takahashii]